MDPLMISAASGMKARMESLDMLANNVANTGTAGFKADREFYSVFHSELPMVEKQWTDFSQGTLQPTGNSLDLALDGKGFFALTSPGGVVYTRNGNFQISRANQLATAEGFTLRNTRNNGQPIAVDPERAVDIDKAGIVRQNGQEVGQIEIAGFGNAATELGKMGSSYFARIEGSAAPGAAPEAQVKQGAIEQSNVPVTDSAVRLVGVMRQFEMMQRAMSVGSEMNKRAMDEVARVN
ncbi:MAG: flagellar hook basal-body protein [Acidobacteriota bacterium]